MEQQDPKINIFKYIYTELKNFYIEIKNIFKKKETIVIWFFVLPINIIITIINVIVGFINYIRLIILFIYKCVKKKLNYKNIKPIKINKRLITFNNYILQTFYFLTFDLAIKKSFILFYNQLYFIKNFFKNKKNLKEKINNFFEIIIFIVIRKIIFFITSIPFFILKNNNEITLIIDDINDMKCKNWEIYISTIFANLIKNFNLIYNFNCKKLKIKFDKKYIYLNPKNVLDIINNLYSKDKLTTGSKLLIKTGRIATIKYNLENRTIAPHPTLLYNTVDTSNNNKSTYFAINQSTKRYLNTGKIIDEHYIEKNKIENIIKVKGLLNSELTAFNVTPHIVHKELTEIISSKKLITNWGQKENWIKQFNLVQSFLINLENYMLKIDKNHGIIIDLNYKSVRDYIDKNYFFFTLETQKGLENLIDFYERNKLIFENNNNKLNFVKCLWLAEIDPEVKNLFKNILEKNI